MKVLAWIVLPGLLTLPCVQAKVKDLDEKSWNTIEGKNAFVMFMAPWCGHCRKLMPEMEKLANDYKSSRTTVIASVDCTSPGGQNLCGKFGVSGYPTLKTFKKGSNIYKGDDYNGAREYNGLKRYVEANLAGPECTLEDKEGCEPNERKILEASEQMPTAERREKIQAMESEIKEKKAEAKSLEAKAKELEKELELWKLGGQKPDRVLQLLGDAEFREHCEHRTCVISFLPHILDGGAAVRNEHLKTLDAVFKRSKNDGHPVGFMWVQGGDQFDIEEKLSLQFGFPAVIAISVKKGKFGVHRGIFEKESLSSFLSSMMLGRVPLQPLPKELKWGKTDPWDGKDGEMPTEEEL